MLFILADAERRESPAMSHR